MNTFANKLLANGILLAIFMTLALTSSQALAQTDEVVIPVQGLLTDGASKPVDREVTITFKLYEDASASAASWEEEQTVLVEDGLFTAYLGGSEPLVGELFRDKTQLYLTMTIDGDSESDRVPLASAPYAAAAKHAGDAQTLQGLTPEQLKPALGASEITYDDTRTALSSDNTQSAIEALVARLDALEQTNADLRARVEALEQQDLTARVVTLETKQQDHASRLNSAEATIVNLQTQANMTAQTVSGFDNRISTVEMSQASQASRLSTVETNQATQSSRIDGVAMSVGSLQAADTAFDGRLSAAEGDITSNDGDIAALDTRAQNNQNAIGSIESKTASMSVVGTDVFFTGVNLHVRNGTGTTSGTVNGTGNLVVGYNEARSTGSEKTGSHNIVFGREANYTSYGGLVGGYQNNITSSHAAVLTGQGGTASGSYAAIVSGINGTASNTTTVVVTGYENIASGFRAGVLSGWQNEASGSYSAILGGEGNTSSGTQSSIGGGVNLTNSTSTRFTAQGTITN